MGSARSLSAKRLILASALVCSYKNNHPVRMIAFDFGHSLRSASTGSFFDAMREGISPAIVVSASEINTSITPPATGNIAIFATPVRCSTIMEIGRSRISVTIMPSKPEMRPMMNASALNTWEMSFLLAPRDR